MQRSKQDWKAVCCAATCLGAPLSVRRSQTHTENALRLCQHTKGELKTWEPRQWDCIWIKDHVLFKKSGTRMSPDRSARRFTLDNMGQRSSRDSGQKAIASTRIRHYLMGARFFTRPEGQRHHSCKRRGGLASLLVRASFRSVWHMHFAQSLCHAVG